MEEEIERWENCGEGKIKNYCVSNFGRVKSVTKVNNIERFLKGTDAGNGYLRVQIDKKLILIHHLVAYAFLGPRPDGLVIDHFDRNSLNNKANNLRYVTYTENNRNTDRYRSDILTSDPKERKAIKDKEYREANKEKISEKKREYYKANRETLLEKHKEYREKKGEELLEKKREYYMANREALLEKTREKYKCECGSTLSKGNKARHEKESKPHLDWLATQV